MPSISPLFFILGLVVASVTADETTTMPTIPGNYSNTTAVTRSITTIDITRNISITSTTGTMNITNTSSTTISPSATTQKGNDSQSTMAKMTSAPPQSIRPKSTMSTTTKKDNIRPTPIPQAGDSTGIIILVVIILVALGFGVACYFARRRGRRYSVDFTSRPDEANIPLSTVEPELNIDTVPQNGLQTFESVEAATKEPEEAEPKPEVKEEQEEQKAEADKSVVDASAESAAPPPAPDSSEDKPKEDVAEQSPPAPVEPSAEEKTDDEGVVSNKTSVESLKETNENNSNNAAFSQQRDLNLFWDVPLDWPV